MWDLTREPAGDRLYHIFYFKMNAQTQPTCTNEVIISALNEAYEMDTNKVPSKNVVLFDMQTT